MGNKTIESRRYLFAVNHPSQFHMFKNLARKLLDDGNHCIFFIQQRGIIEDLVKGCGFEYRFAVSPFWRKKLKGRNGVLLRGIIHIIQSYFRILMYCLTNKVDMLMGSDIAIVHVGALLRKISIVRTDDDWFFTKDYCNLAFPFATHVIASNVVDLGKWYHKKIGYDGNQKTAYIHPDYFVPDPKVLDRYGLEEEKYVIIRLVEFSAFHDVLGQIQSGLNEKTLREIITCLSKTTKVIINAEQGDHTEFSRLCLKLDPSDMHSLLYYARLLITDSQSMHIEAGLLGTPSIRTNRWVDCDCKMSVIDYIEVKYGLGVSVSPQQPDELIPKVKELTADGMKIRWQDKRDKFFRENTNTTDFIYWFVTNYPSSYSEYLNNPGLIDRFRGSKKLAAM